MHDHLEVAPSGIMASDGRHKCFCIDGLGLVSLERTRLREADPRPDPLGDAGTLLSHTLCHLHGRRRVGILRDASGCAYGVAIKMTALHNPTAQRQETAVP